jgi:hypothetical protein
MPTASPCEPSCGASSVVAFASCASIKTEGEGAFQVRCLGQFHQASAGFQTFRRESLSERNWPRS